MASGQRNAPEKIRNRLLRVSVMTRYVLIGVKSDNSLFFFMAVDLQILTLKGDLLYSLKLCG